MNNDILILRKLMTFSDQEISIFQLFFSDYLEENEEKLSKIECFNLACVASTTQYNFRLLKARISGEKNIDEKTNNIFIKAIVSYDGLVDYILKRMEELYNKMDEIEQYQLFNSSHYSHFTADEKIKESIKKDFDRYFKKYKF